MKNKPNKLKYGDYIEIDNVIIRVTDVVSNSGVVVFNMNTMTKEECINSALDVVVDNPNRMDVIDSLMEWINNFYE